MLSALLTAAGKVSVLANALVYGYLRLPMCFKKQNRSIHFTLANSEIFMRNIIYYLYDDVLSILEIYHVRGY